jgi:hypothetical protein
MNEFNTNLPVDFRLVPNGYESWSDVSLSILDGASAIPAQLGGAFATTGLLFDNGFPLTEPTADLTSPPHNVTLSGFPPATLLMSGNVTITTGQPTSTPGQTPTPTHSGPKLTIAPGGHLSARTATVQLRCSGPLKCAGALRIGNHTPIAPPKAKVTTYAAGSFSIAAGKVQSLEVKLSSDGRRAVKGHRSLKAYAIATFSNGATATSPITLRR